MQRAIALAVLATALCTANISGQTAVTTPGGTANSVPKFSGSSTVVNSAITELNGNVGIGTTSPASPLDVNGTISIKGTTVVDETAIATPTDGTYVIASGGRIQGEYILRQDAPYRGQTVHLLVDASQYDGGSTLQILENHSYSGSTVMSNFRLLHSADYSGQYLVMDVANRTGIPGNGGNSINVQFVGAGYWGASFGGVLSGNEVLNGVVDIAVNEGNVGIGTTSPGSKLEVNGDVKAATFNVTGSSGYALNVPYYNPGPIAPLVHITNVLNEGEWDEYIGGSGEWNWFYTHGSVTTGSSGANVMSLDHSGNLLLLGSLTTLGPLLVPSLGSNPNPLCTTANGQITNVGCTGGSLSGTSLPSSIVTSSLTSVGTVTAGVWNATPIASAYLPSNIDYINQAQIISGQKSFTSSVGIGTSTPQALLEVDGSAILGAGFQANMPSGNVFLTGNVPGGDMSGLVLYNAGGGGGSSVSIDLYNTGANGGIPQAKIKAIDDGNYSDNLLFLTKVPGSGNNPVSEKMRITSTGNVGIGTSSPGASLEVNGNIKLSSGSSASMTFPDGTVQSTAWNGVLSGGDYAESVDVLGDRSAYEPGDVIAIDTSAPGGFTKSEKPYSKLVAGVYSTKPGLVGRRATADRPDKDGEVPMAMMGIVPTKVSTENGAIEPGDLLVSSSRPGYAMRGTDTSRLMGTVIGKALGSLRSGSGVIEVLMALQ